LSRTNILAYYKKIVNYRLQVFDENRYYRVRLKFEAARLDKEENYQKLKEVIGCFKVSCQFLQNNVNDDF
jgi:hypothetical protein